VIRRSLSLKPSIYVSCSAAATDDDDDDDDEDDDAGLGVITVTAVFRPVASVSDASK